MSIIMCIHTVYEISEIEKIPNNNHCVSSDSHYKPIRGDRISRM